MSLTMKPCMIAAGPRPKPCIIQTEPPRIISEPTRLVTTRMPTSNARRIRKPLLAGVDVEVALTFGRHAVADLLVIDRARRNGQALSLRFGDLLLVHALAGQRMRDGAVALVARVLEHLVAGARRDHDAQRPRRRERARIVDGCDVL